MVLFNNITSLKYMSENVILFVHANMIITYFSTQKKYYGTRYTCMYITHPLYTHQHLLYLVCNLSSGPPLPSVPSVEDLRCDKPLSDGRSVTIKWMVSQLLCIWVVDKSLSE